MTRRLTILTCVLALAAFRGVAALQEPTALDANLQALRFAAMEIWLDSKDHPLAAYQVEFKPMDAFAASVKIVGIEGGSVAPFASPPYYDPAAMQRERVIIAAFSTAKAVELPRGRTRIAIIHVQITGEREPEFNARTMVAATANGQAIVAEVQAVKAK